MGLVNNARVEPLERRTLLAGELVASFGDDGTVALAQEPTHVFNLSDGGILVADLDNGATPSLGRFLPDGTVDPRFAGAAVLETIGARVGPILKLTVDSADRLLVWGGGIGATPETSVQALARFTAGGRIDRSFGKRGVIHLPMKLAGDPFALRDGRVVVTGSNEEIENFETDARPWGVTVLETNGRIDTRFGQGGSGFYELGEISFETHPSMNYTRSVDAEQAFPLSGGRILYLRETDLNSTTGSIGAYLLNPNGPDGTFHFDRTNVLSSEGLEAFQPFSGLPGEKRAGHLLSGARQLADGTVQFVFSNEADDPTVAKIASLATDGTVYDVRAFAADRAALRGPDGELLVASANGSSMTRYAPDGTAIETFPVALPQSGGTWTPAAFGNDGSLIATYRDADGSPLLLGKIQPTDAPTGVLRAGPIRSERAAAYRFTVTWDDPDGIDVSSLASRAIVVDLPNGQTRTAVFEAATPSDDARTVVATYHLRAPEDGVWDNGVFGVGRDHGRYQVRLRGKHVTDTTGQGATGRVLGYFYVDIGPAPAPAASKLAAGAAPPANVLAGAERDEEGAGLVELS